MMLLAEGFNVISTDASDKMLKYALKELWRRRKEEVFDKWGNYKECTHRHIDSKGQTGVRSSGRLNHTCYKII